METASAPDVRRTFCVKGVFLGPVGVGKTTLYHALNDDGHQNDQHQNTISGSKIDLQHTIEDVKFTIELWDTAGQETYWSLNQHFYRNSDFVISMYGIDEKDSLINMKKMLEQCMEGVGETKLGETFVTILGNKCDLEGSREVPTEDGKCFADTMGYQFMETSAKLGTGVGNIIPGICKALFEALKKTAPKADGKDKVDFDSMKKKEKRC